MIYAKFIATHKCHLQILTDTKILLILLLIKSTSMCKYITLFFSFMIIYVTYTIFKAKFNLKDFIKRYIFLLKKF